MQINVSPNHIRKFQQKIFSWWEENKREFPWRETENPYHILVSEIMLQQTQAPRVVEKYEEFIRKFPDLNSLVKASQTEILSLWSGLGYNRRALWLQEAAKAIIEREEFPKEVKELIKLKGIGPYSSRSILIFAFNQDLATVDTNIRRILIAEGFATETTKEKELMEIARKLVPKGRSRDWHNALMDYGSKVLTASETGIKPTSKQSKFKGSDREYRGKILKKVLEEKTIKVEKLVKDLNLSKEKIKNIIDKMEKDGLIKREKKKIFID